MKNKNEANAGTNAQYKNKDKIEKIKTFQFKDNKIDKNFGNGKKRDERIKNPPSLEKKTMKLDLKLIDEFLKLGQNKTLTNNNNDEKLYQKVEIDEFDKALMICFNYLLRYNKSNEIKEKGELIIIINDKTSFEILDLNPFSIQLFYDNEEKKIILYNTSRIISFVDDNHRIIYKKFICNPDILSKVLKELGFKSYYTRINKNSNNDNISNKEREKEIDSINSEISLGDPSIILNDESINVIYKDNIKPILREEKYNNRFKGYIKVLKDLNNNYEDYYPNNCNNEFMNLNEYDKASLNLFNFKDSKATKILYLYGPKGCSKTTFLLFLINKFSISQTKTLYFNYNYLKDKNFVNMKKTIYNEILYFCLNIKEMKNIELFKIFDGIDQTKNSMEIIYQLLVNLFKVIDGDENCKRIIIIDNINNLNEKDEAFLSLNNIKQLILRKNNNFKLIISGNGKYFNKQFIKSYENLKIMENDKVYSYTMKEYIYLFSTSLNRNNTNNNLLNENEIKSENNLDAKLISEELTNLTNYSFAALFFAEELDNKYLSYDEVIKDDNLLDSMPLEYFNITFNDVEPIEKIYIEGDKNKATHFTFYNQIFKEAVKKKIEFQVENGILTLLLKNQQLPRTIFGVCFEKMITLLLKYNQINNFNLKFQETNIKEVEEISDFKENNINYNSIFQDIDKDKPILITQKNYFGKFYDLLIIIRYNNIVYSNFIQIGLDKDMSKINDILTDITLNENLYKKEISRELDIDINIIKISLFFIFDYETQKKHNFLSGVKFCRDKSIDYYLFSMIECKFLINSDKTDNIIFINNFYPYYNTRNYKISINSEKNKKTKETDKKNTKIEQYFKIDN